MRNALAIAAVNLVRLFRDPSTFFFIFVLPLLLIVVIGSTSAGARPIIGVVPPSDPGPTARDMVDDLGNVEGARTVTVEERADALEQLRRGELAAVVLLPDGIEETLIAGDQVTVGYLSTPAGGGFRIRALVDAVAGDHNARIGAERLVVEAGTDPAAAAEVVKGVDASLAGTGVEVIDVDGEAFAEVDNFSIVASQQLVLFMFLNSMMAAAALIQARRLGVIQRMSASPASAAEILAGQALGRYGVVLFQSLFIVAATALLFGVGWGSWPATLTIVAVFGLVATAAALLIGALVSNENQSTAIGLALGLSLAALGGCMVPLEVFPPTLATIAHVTPHAWAVGGLGQVIAEGGGLADVTTEIGVLTGYGAALLAIGTLALRRSIIA